MKYLRSLILSEAGLSAYLFIFMSVDALSSSFSFIFSADLAVPGMLCFDCFLITSKASVVFLPAVGEVAHCKWNNVLSLAFMYWEGRYN